MKNPETVSSTAKNEKILTSNINPRCLEITSFFLDSTKSSICFKYNYQYWLDNGVLKEITQDEFFNFLTFRILDLNYSADTIKEMKILIQNNLELNYLTNFNKTNFRIFQYLRFRGNLDMELVKNILTLEKANLIDDLFFDPEGISAIGKIDSNSNLLTDAYEIILPNRRTLNKITDIWIPSQYISNEILIIDQKYGYNINILKKALDILNYCANSYLINDGILLLVKVDIIIAIAPKEI